MIGLEELREDFPGWRIWWSEQSGLYHAHRKVETFVESEASPRRFCVHALDPWRLAAMLAAQAVADDAELAAYLDQYTSQRGDGSPPDSPR